MSPVKVSGLAQLQAELDNRLGNRKTQWIIDRALISGAKVIIRELQGNFRPWMDTGASYAEMTYSQPYTLAGVRTIKIHWRGPKNRYAIIHLNEFGTIKNPNPRGKGSVQRALRSGQAEYHRVVADGMRRYL